LFIQSLELDFLFFKIRPDRPRCTSSLPYNEYWSLSCGKRGQGVPLTTHIHLYRRLKKE